jgi:antitoxin component YwqK of YwqJK toxin-antitoxin module
VKFFSIILCLILAACSQPSLKQPNSERISIADQVKHRTVLITDTSLQLQNGKRYFKGKTFNGTMEEYYPSGQLKLRQTFIDGQEEGFCETHYQTGKLDAMRYYHLGEKDSVHTGWWENGRLRFEYHFKAGKYAGDFKEWYETGQLLKHLEYEDGIEKQGKGWRANGKLYMSFVRKNGRLFGLVNPNLCYSLKNERGEYVNSPK